ncbi:AbrB/MazE/SpoVT family DNA-binding domain-containing protein [Noviherbaspirillum pedocola]|uniref:AbrB/MazE/SpoVT family DNA-binding domain-containing protein n=1 Tax=Noviherbaspirillum pedocola TaxID=2801341 RepID=A0A934SS75_9BURK|nr:AbrB/MazE/SpoVT family DNA-binding domain-containing protein [Noviherbaspirillum pedocola]MBK4734510.1 AbrB/MazE/SpoVT family DNA-binding domain-containing protein [Noviherbaspirillum pedocola]
MQVSKWGNSLAIRLPAAVVEALDLKEGDDVQIRVAGDRSVEIERTPSRADIIMRLRSLRGSIPSDFKFDRAEATER